MPTFWTKAAAEKYQETENILDAVGAGIGDAALSAVGGNLIKTGGKILGKGAKYVGRKLAAPKAAIPKLAFATEVSASKFTPSNAPKAAIPPPAPKPVPKPVVQKPPENVAFSKKTGTGGGNGKPAPKPEPPKAPERVIPTKEMQNACWGKLKQSGEWRHDKGHSKSTLENKKTGQFLQKSIEKWELEVFDKHEKHIGTMRPNEPGIIRTEFAVRGRKMEK